MGSLGRVGWGHTVWALSTQPPCLTPALEAVAHILPLLAHCQWLGLVHAGEVGTRVFSLLKVDVTTTTGCPPMFPMTCAPLLEVGMAAGPIGRNIERWDQCGPQGHRTLEVA